MKQAFIVYAPEDRITAVRLWDKLNWHGLEVGIDLQEVPPHLDRTAVLEDMVSVCDLLILIVSPHSDDHQEFHRLHLLAIEQLCDMIAVLLPGGRLPDLFPCLRQVVFGDYQRGFEHLLRLIPDRLITKEPDPNRIIANLHDESPEVRRMNLFLVGSKRLTAGFRCALALVITDPDPAVRAAAAWVLDQLGIVDAAPVLLLALYDPSIEVRSNAGWGLVNFGRRRDAPASRAIIPAVIEVLRSGPNEHAREMAYLILVRLGGREANDAIERYWNNK